MSYFRPARLEQQRKRFMRPEPYREKSYAARMVDEMRAQEEEAARAAEQEAMRAELEHLHRLVKDLRIDLALRRLRFKYSPDQPRDDRGRWVGEPDKGPADDAGKVGSDKPSAITDISAARKVPTIVKEFGKWTARQYVSRYCEAKVNRELPGEFENTTISDIWNIARGGDARARTCMKLMQPRFKK